MKHIGKTTDKEVILTLTTSEMMDLLLYLNSAELRYHEQGKNQAKKECFEMEMKLYEIWEKVK